MRIGENITIMLHVLSDSVLFPDTKVDIRIENILCQKKINSFLNREYITTLYECDLRCEIAYE